MEGWMKQRDSWEDTFFAYCEYWEDAFFEYCVHCGCKNWESLPGRRAYCTAWYHDSIISFWSFTWQCGKFSGALAGPYPGPAPHCRRPAAGPSSVIWIISTPSPQSSNKQGNTRPRLVLVTTLPWCWMITCKHTNIFDSKQISVQSQSWLQLKNLS